MSKPFGGSATRIDWRRTGRCFNGLLKVLAQSDLLRGKTRGIDATTLEANAGLAK